MINELRANLISNQPVTEGTKRILEKVVRGRPLLSRKPLYQPKHLTVPVTKDYLSDSPYTDREFSVPTIKQKHPSSYS